MCKVRHLSEAIPKAISIVMIFMLAVGMVLSTALLPRVRPVLAATPGVSIQRVSVPSMESDNYSDMPSISADGRYVAFDSVATNLVPNDTNGSSDVFVHDRQMGQITRISVSSSGGQCDHGSFSPRISADGRYVAFLSDATNLVSNDTNGHMDVFVHDRQTGETTRVSLASDGAEGDGSTSSGPSISADGRYVAFGSGASNLVPDDTNHWVDLFVHDRQTGETTRVSLASDKSQGNGLSGIPSISADGRYVAFRSNASNLVPNDTNGRWDVFVHDRQMGETTRVSLASDSTEGNGHSNLPSISADGRYVAFHSVASNLVPDDTNATYDVFVHDRQTGETTRVSLASDSGEGNGDSYNHSISADGRYVAFHSVASNLVPDDTNATYDVFVHDRQTGETTRVSLASDSGEGNGDSYRVSISDDGRYVAFLSAASNLVPNDTNGAEDIFVHDRQTGETTRVSLGRDGIEGNDDSYNTSISADGRYVAFLSQASNLFPPDTLAEDDFVHDRQTGETTMVSLASDGTHSDGRSLEAPSISADGRYVAFASWGSNLILGDTNGCLDVFVFDRQTGETSRVSLASDGTEGNESSSYPSISADGRYVAFLSQASNLVPNDTNSVSDVFVFDRQTGETSRVSLASDSTEGNGHSWPPSISADGRYVAFASWGSNLVLGDTNGCLDVFVFDRQTGETSRVSLASDGTEGNDDSNRSGGMPPSITADGRRVAFYSDASNLVPNDTNSVSDVFVHDRQTGETTRVSLGWDGTEGNDDSCQASISADGRYVAFESGASNLVSGDTNGVWDVFIHDRQTGETPRVSLAWDGSEGNGHSFSPSISADGRYVAFESQASNLVPGDTNGKCDVFVVSWLNPELAYAPTSVDFGARYQSSTATQTLQVQNSGTGTLSYSLSEDSPWCSLSPATGDGSGEQDTITITVNTSGLSPGHYSCVILIGSDGGLGIVPVYLSVQPTPTIAVTPASKDFGSVAIGSSSDQTFTVSNTGTADLVVGTVAAANPVAAPFSIVSDTCSGQTIAPAGIRTLTVRFSPTVEGSFTDSFDIPSNDPNAPTVTVSLTGSGPNRAPTAPVVDVIPDSPTTADNLVCSIATQSTDADSDSVTYTYQWYKGDVLQSALTTNTVPAADTAKGEVWRCVVTPGDGTASGPSAADQVTVQNTAPTAVVVDVTPDSPTAADDLVCSITTQSTDADTDSVTYTYQWYKDGVLQPGLTEDDVSAADTAGGEVWRCVVTPSDGTASGPYAEAEVTVEAEAIEDGTSGGLPAGAIAGIVIGVLAVAGAAAFLWFRRSKKAPPFS